MVHFQEHCADVILAFRFLVEVYECSTPEDGWIVAQDECVVSPDDEEVKFTYCPSGNSMVRGDYWGEGCGGKVGG